MFEGDGFGVGLTIGQLPVPAGPGAALVPADPHSHPTRLGELMPVGSRHDVGLGEELRRVNIADSRLWAYRLEIVAELAARRLPAATGPPPPSGASATPATGTAGNPAATTGSAAPIWTT